jgi:hypothetical protein
MRYKWSKGLHKKAQYSTMNTRHDTCKEQEENGAGTGHMRLPQSLLYNDTERGVQNNILGQFPHLQRAGPPQAGYMDKHIDIHYHFLRHKVENEEIGTPVCTNWKPSC